MKIDVQKAITQTKTALEFLNKEMSEAVKRHEDHLQSLVDRIQQTNESLFILEEKRKEFWITNPDFLVLSTSMKCVLYPCEWKKYKDNKWKRGYIVGSSYNTGKLYKIQTSKSGSTYDWACEVRVDPEELKMCISENTHRMLSSYNVDIEESSR